MSLKAKIDNDIKIAMKAREKERLLALRDIKKMILMEETKAGYVGELTEGEEMKILQRAVKQRKDSAEVYRAQDRPDLLEKEEAEIAVIEDYLPKQLSEAEVEEKLKEIIAQVGATSPADMGKVMGAATKQMAGITDGKTISTLTKKLLA
ncbi:MAG: hypothetical protein ACI9V1_002567 [Spirosomataceae bacterium]|jgi:uncharacterized protein YqeY